MQRLIFFIVLALGCVPAKAQLKISDNHHYIVRKDGRPFFWLGDTAWELFHRLNREEAVRYLDNRTAKGFTVIQAVALAELDGLNTPNAYGNKPLVDNDPLKPNEAYFSHVDFVVSEANKRGLIVAMLPTWGDKWNKGEWGIGPEIFNPANAEKYGEWIGKRYRNKSLVWVLGGDRRIENDTQLAVIRNMARGIRKSDPDHLITFHPTGGRTSSEYFADDDWIDLHMSQTGHRVGNPDYKRNIEAYALKNPKPHVNGEPNYEDHPNDFKPAEKGWMDDVDTREAAYWNMLSGGAGHTYGNHNIWQMYDEKRKPVNNARTAWTTALDQPGAYQVGYMRKMMEKRNWQQLRFDQSAITGDNPEDVTYRVCAVSREKDFLMVYVPYGQKTTIKTSVLNAKKIRGWWFNPRDGRSIALGDFDNTGSQDFIPSSIGRGSDWVLVLDDAAKNYPDPAVNQYRR